MKRSVLFLVCVSFLYMYGYNVQTMLSSMSLQEKIGQLFVVATTSNFEQQEELLASSLSKCPYRMDHDYIQYLIEQYHIGGIIFLYKSTAAAQVACTKKFQQLSKTPLLVCQDGEWGVGMRLYDTLSFPRNIVLGALPNKQLIYNIGREIARQYKLLGVHMNFSPVVDCNTNPHNPVIGSRSFGSDPEIVAQCGVLMMRGLQDGGIAACAKHFPGHGDTSTDSHVALPVVPYNRMRLQAVELYPFSELIRHDVAAVMTAHIIVPAYDTQMPATLSKKIVTDLLQTEMGFCGVVVTDGLGMEALSAYGQPGERELHAFLAGNDILLCPLDIPAAVAKIEQAITDGVVSLDFLEHKVAKICALKIQYDVFEPHCYIPDDELYKQLHTQESVALVATVAQ